MTVVELARQVKEARNLQKAYFDTRTQTALQASKEAEKRLDRTLADILDPPSFFGSWDA